MSRPTAARRTDALTSSYTTTLPAGVERRIADDRGRMWRIRELLHGYGLFFRCEVRGVRAEYRPSGSKLAMLSDAELLDLLERAEE